MSVNVNKVKSIITLAVDVRVILVPAQPDKVDIGRVSVSVGNDGTRGNTTRKLHFHMGSAGLCRAEQVQSGNNGAFREHAYINICRIIVYIKG